MDAIENGPKCDKTAAFRETNSGYLDKLLKFIYFFWAKLDYRCFTGIGKASLTAKTNTLRCSITPLRNGGDTAGRVDAFSGLFTTCTQPMKYRSRSR